jgi:biopolymer transport protein ExbD
LAEMNDQREKFNLEFQCKRDRIQNSSSYLVYTVFISFGLAILISFKTLSLLNPRVGLQAQPPLYQAQSLKEGAIWLSLSASDRKLFIRTEDQQSIEVDLGEEGENQFESLQLYLNNEVEKKIESAVLMGELKRSSLFAILSVDRTLRFEAVAPVIEVLAKAGISNYGFETQRVLK